MLTIDLNAVTEMLFNRMAIDNVLDSSAQLLRAELGTYQDEDDVTQPGIIHARHLDDDTRRPTTPFIAYREGPLITRSVTIQVPTYRIFVYDEPAEGYWRINKIMPLIGKAIAAKPRLRVQVGALVGYVDVVSISGASVDPSLGGLLWRNMQVTVDTTW